MSYSLMLPSHPNNIRRTIPEQVEIADTVQRFRHISLHHEDSVTEYTVIAVGGEEFSAVCCLCLIRVHLNLTALSFRSSGRALSVEGHTSL